MKPERNVLYECYNEFFDMYGDFCEKGTLCRLNQTTEDRYYFITEELSWGNYEGDGVFENEYCVDKIKWMWHFCPAPNNISEEKHPKGFISDQWDYIKANFDIYPTIIQDLILADKPDLFKQKIYTFDPNTFPTSDSKGMMPFFVNNQFLLDDKLCSRKNKCLVVQSNWKPEIFEAQEKSTGATYQCIRFVKK